MRFSSELFIPNPNFVVVNLTHAKKFVFSWMLRFKAKSKTLFTCMHKQAGYELLLKASYHQTHVKLLLYIDRFFIFQPKLLAQQFLLKPYTFSLQ